MEFSYRRSPVCFFLFNSALANPTVTKVKVNTSHSRVKTTEATEGLKAEYFQFRP